MKTAKEYRDQAWNSLEGKWMDGVIIALVYLLIVSVFAGGNVFTAHFGGDQLASGSSTLLNLANIFLITPLGAAIAMMFLDFVRGEKIAIPTVIDHFKNHYSTVLIAGVIISVLSFLGIVTLGILSIYFALCYGMTFYIIRDYPELTWREAMKTSREMMYGHKFDYLWLQLSFIGWIILCICTMGIGLLWLMPYMQTTEAAFYNDLKAETIVEENDGVQEAEVVE